jgi:peptide-methionine (R)-S-oxide reductase
MKRALLLLLVLAGCHRAPSGPNREAYMGEKIVKSEDEWKKQLDPKAYDVLRKHGTERAFSGTFNEHKDEGIYVCAGCGLELFESKTKFDSGTGWPSFYAPLKKEHIGETEDSNWGMKRTEVHCPRCGGHLGHVFPDGPKPTGLRYCINSVSLDFKKK